MAELSDIGKDEIHHRYFYHLRCTLQPPARWQHNEPDTEEKPLFDFFWVAFPLGIPNLIADHGIMLPKLSAVIDME